MPPTLPVGWARLSHWLPKTRERGKQELDNEKAGELYFSQALKVNIIYDVVCLPCTHTLIWCVNASAAFFTKTHNPSLIMKKSTDKPRLGDVSRDAWPVCLKTLKVMKNNAGLKNCHGPERRGRRATKCNVTPWTGSWDRKRTSMGKLLVSK